jgi:hypothetical protein
MANRVARVSRYDATHENHPIAPISSDGGEGVVVKRGPNRRGRKPGSRNKVTTALKEAILLAAANVGRDGKGRDGLVGYLEKLARTEPRSFASLLGRVVPLHIVGGVDHTHRLYNSKEEVIAALKEKGLPVESVYPQDLDTWEPENDGKGH